MVRLQTIFLVLLAGLAAVGCGVVPRSAQPPTQAVADSTVSSNTNTPAKPSPATSVSSLDETKASLMQAYRHWKGAPYELGGASKKGVDCSRLINIIFDEYFGIDLPTNTKKQLNEGESIRRASVHTGDLVFFRTGRKTLHVGIAVNQGEFLHASTSDGVKISKLGNSYWRKRFLEARRIL